MIKSLVNSSSFKMLNKEAMNLSHAYLFYSQDKLLNNNLAELFAMKLFCENKMPCFNCEACKRTILNKNPDLLIIDKDSISVEDVANILDNSNLKPMIYANKVVIIKNAETINEIAQNKLLKLLEEPTGSLTFILTTVNEDRLLPTIRSRLKKVFLSLPDINIVQDELIEQNANVNLINSSFSLTEILENSNNSEFYQCLDLLQQVLIKLNSTQDLPECVSMLKLTTRNKFIYLNLLDKIFSSKLEGGLFDEKLLFNIDTKFNDDLKIKCKGLIEKAYKQLRSNVNPNYVFDILFYSILKEKYISNK